MSSTDHGEKFSTEKHQAAVDETPAKPAQADAELKPVSFFGLFRFSTRLEIFLDIIGIIAAVAAGAAQVRVSCWVVWF